MVDGSVGAIVGDPPRPIAVVAFTVANDRIVGIDLVANPPSVRRLDRRLTPEATANASPAATAFRRLRAMSGPEMVRPCVSQPSPCVSS